jgi:hypothetical protein
VIGLLFLACTCKPAATPAPTPAPTPAVQTPTQPPITVWTKDNIAQLTPVAPSRSSTVSKPIPAIPAYDEALSLMNKIVDRYAGDPNNPWAVVHGLLARNSSFKLTDGREAIPALFAMYAESKELAGQRFIGFPKSKGEIRIEPHTDLLLKNFQEAGAAVSDSFQTASGQTSLADLYRYTLLKTYIAKDQVSFESPNDMPWGVQALATWAPPGELQWIAANGTPMDMDDLSDFLVTVLTKESAFMFDTMQKGQKFTRSGQSLFGYTCGGAHLVQGASYAVARGFGSRTSKTAIEAQVPLLFYRMPIELAQLEEFRKKNPKYNEKLLVQQIKFLGHFLETMSKLQILGFYTPDDAQLKLLEMAAQKLVVAVQALRDGGVLDGMEALRVKDEQLYLDVIGDSAHAIRGLELALGRGKVAF